MVDKSLFDEKGKLKPVQISLGKKVKDWWIKGFQLNRCYQRHWEEIRDVFDNFDIDMNRQGPIITIQALKQVKMAKTLTEKIKNDPEIRKIAKNSNFSLRTVYYTDADEEKVIDGVIFIMLLRLIPEFCMEVGMRNLNSFMDNGNSKEYLKKVFSVDGTILDTEKDIERIAKDMLKEVAKIED